MTFQFTHPGRGATLPPLLSPPKALVSIHAPREGCDIQGDSVYLYPSPVSIHAPREGCDALPEGVQPADKFQFTHPGRGAT